MTTYKSIRGLTLQSVTTDPEVYAGSWSSGNNLNTARSRMGGSTQATQTAGIIFGGGDPPYGQTEEYNGTSWSEQNDMNGGRYISYGGGGTQTATITAGGYYPAGSPQYQTVLSETYNGTSWTEVNELNTGRIDCTTFGTSTAALLVGGGSAAGGPGTVANVESWNGTSWSETTDIPATRQEMAGWGLATAGAIVGGSQDSNPTMTAETLEYDGSSWTAGGDYSSVVKYFTAFGTADNGIAAGGSTGSANLTVAANYNGTAWTEVAELASVRRGNMSNGASGTSGLTAGGETPAGANMNVTEEWSFPSAPVVQLGQVWFNENTVTLKGYVQQGTGSWSSGGTMNTSREQGADFGSLTAGVAAGGGGSVTNVEEYNGTSRAEVYDICAAGGATGTQTAGIIFGFKQSSPVRVDVMTYDGTNFTEVNNLNTGRNVGGSAGGVQTSALYAGGGGSIDNTEIWDGTSWTEVNNLNDGRYFLKGGGTTTAAVLAGGYGGSPNTNPAQSEQWDGTSWTEGNNLNTGRAFLTGGGSNYNSVLIFGGGPPVIDNTEFWNGTSWSEENDMATASETSHGTTQGTGLGTYRARTPAGGATEEWTVAAGTKTLSIA